MIRYSRLSGRSNTKNGMERHRDIEIPSQQNLYANSVSTESHTLLEIAEHDRREITMTDVFSKR